MPYASILLYTEPQIVNVRTSKMFSFQNSAHSRGHNHNGGDRRYHPVGDRSFDYRSWQIANWFAINGFAPSY
jgi:hypothetical protein